MTKRRAAAAVAPVVARAAFAAVWFFAAVPHLRVSAEHRCTTAVRAQVDNPDRARFVGSMPAADDHGWRGKFALLGVVGVAASAHRSTGYQSKSWACIAPSVGKVDAFLIPG